jgi:hypothetical protein
MTIPYTPQSMSIMRLGGTAPEISEAVIAASIVETDWRCNDPQCCCQRETDDERFRRSVYIGRRP